MQTCAQTLQAETLNTTGFARPYGYKKPSAAYETKQFIKGVGRLLGYRPSKPVVFRTPPSAR